MRIELLDNIRGYAFILMFIFHIYVFLNLFTNININLDNIYINLIGIISRYLFITIFGISLYLSYYNLKDNYKKYKKKYFMKILILFISSLYITLFTYIIIPDKFIIFGILHFMCLSMILLFYIIDNFYLLSLLLFLLIIFKNNFSDLKKTNNILYGILGIGYYKNSIDHFYLLKWLYLVIIGIFIGYFITKYLPKNNKKVNINLQLNIIDKNIIKYIGNNNFIKFNYNNNIIKYIGNNSLYLYLIHFPIIYIVIKLLYN